MKKLLLFLCGIFFVACVKDSPKENSSVKSGNFSGIWKLSIQSFSKKDCRKFGPPEIAISCTKFEDRFPDYDLTITDYQNTKVTIGLDESCKGKIFDGHLVTSQCKEFVFLGDGEISDDFKLIDTNHFSGTRTAIYINEYVVYSATVNVIGTRKH